MGSGASLAQHSPALPQPAAHPFRLSAHALFLALRYHCRRLSSRLHRLRLTLHARGLRGVAARVARGSHGQESAASSSIAACDAALTGTGPRILVIDVTTPRPDRDSGSMRAQRLLGLLVDLGYRVDFLPDDGRHAGRYSEALSELGVRSHYLSSPSARLRWIREHAPDCVAVLISRYHLAEPLFPLLRQIAPCARLVLDTVDLHHLREEREADQRRDRTLKRLAAGTRRRELATIAAADVTWVVSPSEQALLAVQLPSAVVHIVSNVHDPIEDVPGPEGRRGAVFVGGAGHPPNLDAVSWLIDTLWPAIRRKVPDLELHLVGEGLGQTLDEVPPGVILHGYLPDLTPLLGEMRVALAPLRFGAGVKGKVNLGMAHGLPMIVTGCAAEGMHLVHGRHAFIADVPEDFARSVADLCRDDTLWRQMSLDARAHIAQHFSMSAAREAIAGSLPTSDTHRA